MWNAPLRGLGEVFLAPEIVLKWSGVISSNEELEEEAVLEYLEQLPPGWLEASYWGEASKEGRAEAFCVRGGAGPG